jgi:hypothetical protein
LHARLRSAVSYVWRDDESGRRPALDGVATKASSLNI